MIHHLLFILSEEQISNTKEALIKLGAQKKTIENGLGDAFLIEHESIGRLKFLIYINSDIDSIIPHLREQPLDLLLYDERNGNIKASIALHKIQKNIVTFAKQWGVDFVFPMNRVVAIINESIDKSDMFELGRVHIRDVCVAPKSMIDTLKWISKLYKKRNIKRNKIGFAMSGGGLEGFLYQLGVIHALNKAILADGSLRDSISIYSGVSSGAIASALLATNVPTGEVIKSTYSQSNILPPLSGSLLYDLAAKDITKRTFKNSLDFVGLDPRKWGEKLIKNIPTGFFKGEALRQYFKNAILQYGGSDSFKDLSSKLYIGATDMDSFEHVIFGKKPWDDIDISLAMRASASLPPFFTPVELHNRWFFDGQITKDCSLELLAKENCGLIFIIDPLKPFTSFIAGETEKRGGFFAVLQTLKALIHTRFQNTLQHLSEKYPDIDFVVFQPKEDCARIMSGSPMRYKIRTQIIETAYTQTIQQLRERHHVYSSKIERYNLGLKDKNQLKLLESFSF